MRPMEGEFGNYRFRGHIGQGGTAELFLAAPKDRTATIDNWVVVKRLLPRLRQDEAFIRMLVEEAELGEALRHRNIVEVYEHGVVDGEHYLAMEYVPGKDLQRTLVACHAQSRGFPTDIALYIVGQVLRGLDHAHSQCNEANEPLGIIHRDVSPSNVLLSYGGEVKIGDFGIAKANHREKTAAGVLKGKSRYMAPEQIKGAALDRRTDIFAVGILLYELLTGQQPFQGSSDREVLELVRRGRIDPPLSHFRPDLDPELEAIVEKALASDPDARYSHAAELHNAIGDCVFQAGASMTATKLGQFMGSLFPMERDDFETEQKRITQPMLPKPHLPDDESAAQAQSRGESKESTDANTLRIERPIPVDREPTVPAFPNLTNSAAPAPAQREGSEPTALLAVAVRERQVTTPENTGPYFLPEEEPSAETRALSILGRRPIHDPAGTPTPKSIPPENSPFSSEKEVHDETREEPTRLIAADERVARTNGRIGKGGGDTRGDCATAEGSVSDGPEGKRTTATPKWWPLSKKPATAARRAASLVFGIGAILILTALLILWIKPKPTPVPIMPVSGNEGKTKGPWAVLVLDCGEPIHLTIQQEGTWNAISKLRRPVTPGAHRVTVTRDRFRVWEGTIHAAKGATVKIPCP